MSVKISTSLKGSIILIALFSISKVALGTLLSSSNEHRQSAADLDLMSKVRTWREVGGSEKVKDCAAFILEM